MAGESEKSKPVLAESEMEKPVDQGLEKEVAPSTGDTKAPHNTTSTPQQSVERNFEASTEPEGEEDEDADKEYPSGPKATLIMVSLYLAVFLVALDRTIIATAIPQITNAFHSLPDIGWYGSAYMMTSCAFQLLYGKLYVFYSTKITFLSAVLLFEIGSAVCGAAPNSAVFIWGRAIAGFGSAGIFSGSIVVMTETVPLRKRPMWQGIFGAVFGIASVVGPLIDGAFTVEVTWRWCFYINLPFGAVTALVITILLRVPPPPDHGKPLSTQLLQIDPLGTFFFLPGVVSLLLALQWGGSTYSWPSSRIIALLVLSMLLLIAFILVQIFHKNPSHATIPLPVLKQRSMAAGFYYTFLSGAAMLVFIYFLATWFQAIQGISAYTSGIRLLPLVLALVAGSMVGGAVTWNVGCYTPPLILGTIIMSVGAGMLTTLTPQSPQAKWVGYQFLYGFGLGLGLQAPSLAAQTVLSKADVPVGASLMFFAQWLGGAVFLSVGQNVLSNELVKGLAEIPGFDVAWVVSTGATDLKNVVPEEWLGKVLGVYNDALMKVFDMGVGLSAAAVLGAVSMEWSVKEEHRGKQ